MKISIIFQIIYIIILICLMILWKRKNKILSEQSELLKGTLDELKAIEDKQIAKKPTVLINDKDIKVGCVTFRKGVKTYKCVCGCWITLSQDYCIHCGQKQDWSVLEDWSGTDE